MTADYLPREILIQIFKLLYWTDIINFRTAGIKDTSLLSTLDSLIFQKIELIENEIEDPVIISKDKVSLAVTYKDPLWSYILDNHLKVSIKDLSNLKFYYQYVKELKINFFDNNFDKSKIESFINNSLINLISLEACQQLKVLIPLKTLKLGECSLININISELEYLSITSNDYLKLEHPTLQKLKIKTSKLNGQYLNLPKLKELEVNYDGIVEIENINLPNLEKLVIDVEELKSKPESSSEIIHSKHVWNCDLNSLALRCNVQIIEELTKSLKNLDLSENNLEDVNCLKNLVNLTSIDLGYNELSSISFENLINLRYLNLESNKIDPKKLFLNENLIELNLSYNYLENLDLRQVPNLKFLNINDNSLREIENLNKNIKILRADRNLFRDFNFNGDSIDELYLSENQLTQPNFLSITPKILDLSNNLIFDLKLNGSRLEVLDLGGNYLTKFDFDLPLIHKLFLNKNDLNEFKIISNHLKILGLALNKLSNLYIETPWLEVLDIAFNENLNLEMVAKNAMKLKNLFRLLSSESQSNILTWWGLPAEISVS